MKITLFPVNESVAAQCWCKFFSILEEDSVFDESDVHDTPTGAANKESQTFFARLKRIGGSKSVKYQPVELNAKKSKKQRLSEWSVV